MSSPNSYTEFLIPNVMVFRGGAFRFDQGQETRAPMRGARVNTETPKESWDLAVQLPKNVGMDLELDNE